MFLALSTDCHGMSSPWMSSHWISSCCRWIWCNSKELIGSWCPRFPTPMVESSSTDLLPSIKSYWAESHWAKGQNYAAVFPENQMSCRLLMAKSRSMRKHLDSQLSWVAAWLLVKHVCPVHLVHFPKIHRSVLHKMTIDLLYFWDVYDVNLWQKKIRQKYGLFMWNYKFHCFKKKQ